MCTVLAWRGKLPPKSLSALLVAAQCRGVHSTGIAWQTKVGDYKWAKNAEKAEDFVADDAESVSQAEKAEFGIGHCRNASANMPIDTCNAHPFVWKSLIFAHNGAVRNWKQIKTACFPESMRGNITTDSMVLGPLLEFKDLSKATGSFGLVWIHKKSLWLMRSAKELEVITMKWVSKDGSNSGNVVICASTMEIIETAFYTLDVTYEFERYRVEEGVLYEMSSSPELMQHGKILVNSDNKADKHSSEAIK